jgi:hypothetical protein
MGFVQKPEHHCYGWEALFYGDDGPRGRLKVGDPALLTIRLPEAN